MALIFQRLARNFLKNGYFPTDAKTMSGIISALSFSGNKCTIIDPCCGEGTALAEVQHALQQDDQVVKSYGIEYDEERAWHSKEILDYCIHGDVRECLVGIRQYSLLFLNPPYGDAVSDNAQLSDPTKGKLRLEKEFYRRTNGYLQFGGVMVLIVPYYVLDKEFGGWISTNFNRVKAFMAPEQQFKQCVIFGVKQRVSEQWSSSSEYYRVRDHLAAIGSGEVIADKLPENWLDLDEPYLVPATSEQPKFELSRLDRKQLAESLAGKPSLWRQYDTLFSHFRTLDHKRPLCDVSRWHLSLLLAAGQVSGVVKGKSGRTFVVRGNTYKSKRESVVASSDGNRSEKVTTRKDIFVPAIRGLDMTPGSESFGDVFVIK